MKTKFLLFGMLFVNLTFGQLNFSSGSVEPNFANAIPAQQFNGGEIFRFRSGLVTQLDAGSAFNTSTSQWFAMGRLGGTANGFNQTFYGLRFQQPNRSILMGYTSASPNNPVLQWIGSGATLGNLEFRTASAFGVPGSPAPDKLVATMRNDGNTAFGENVGVNSYGNARLQIGFDGPANTDLRGVSIIRTNENVSALNSTSLFSIARGQSVSNVGVSAQADGSGQAFGLQGSARSTTQDACGVFGVATTLGNAFECGVFGASNPIARAGRFAAFFDGAVGVTGTLFSGSDIKLKDNVKLEVSALDKISKLKPVTYDFKKISEINLPSGNQHGFIAQELATVFPELTENIKKPVFDKDNLITSNFEYKAVNYMGLISILTAGIQELNIELKTVRQELSEVKLVTKTIDANNQGFYMEQNLPNPFTDQTVVRYKLPNGTTTAEIAVFDMTGKPVKSYLVNNSQTEITIKSSDIGVGLFIYSLIQNGQELITKRMIVK